MIRPDSMEQLVALAERLASAVNTAHPNSAAQLRQLRAAIRSGDDPLGADFSILRSAAERRERGAIYTPRAIVDTIVDWARREPGASPERIIDPGAGSGRFLLSAARAFPKAKLVAIEIDPLAAKLLRANAAIAGFSDRLTVYNADYLSLTLPSINGRTLFIGNPPYIRHHLISATAKDWFASTAKRFGFKASKLAGLHIHFFLRTRELAKEGDFGAFITSSEWLDVNYGSLLRQLLADGLGGTALHVLDASARPFEDAMTTGTIACFRVGNRPRKFTVRSVANIEGLAPLTDGQELDWATVTSAARWSSLSRTQKRKPSGVVELGELFRVHRGQVTGCNAVWIAGRKAAELPARYLVPCVTKAREIFSTDGELRDTKHLRRVVDLPVDLDMIPDDERRIVDEFLKWSRSCGAHEAYVAKNRRAWWSVGLRKPPPIICTYMARRPPAFVRNLGEASLLNIAHGLYPVEPMTEPELTAILNYLRQTVTVAGGRTYAGGLVKFEPREVERLYVPAPELLAGLAMS